MFVVVGDVDERDLARDAGLREWPAPLGSANGELDPVRAREYAGEGRVCSRSSVPCRPRSYSARGGRSRCRPVSSSMRCPSTNERTPARPPPGGEPPVLGHPPGRDRFQCLEAGSRQQAPGHHGGQLSALLLESAAGAAPALIHASSTEPWLERLVRVQPWQFGRRGDAGMPRVLAVTSEHALYPSLVWSPIFRDEQA